MQDPLFSSLLLSSLELSVMKVYELETRALLGIAAHFCNVGVLEFGSRHWWMAAT